LCEGFPMNVGSKVTKCRLPRVSVLMTVFNAEKTVLDSLCSLYSQTFEDWQVIVVENGSTDGSAEIIRAQRDRRLCCTFFEDNVGRTAALRFAFAQARSEYVAVLDADDIALPERFRSQVEFLDKNPEHVLVGSWCTCIDADGAVLGWLRPPTEELELRSLLASGNPFVHSSSMYRRSAALAVGGYPAHRFFAQDYALWLRLTCQGRVGMIDRELCLYRSSPSGLTQAPSQKLEVVTDQLAALVEARGFLNFDEEMSRRHREEVAILGLKIFLARLKRGKFLDAGSFLIRRFLSDPISMVWNRVVRDRLRFLRSWGNQPSQS
jgi:glycosyltransferase involved in cell wall biosynthesis